MNKKDFPVFERYPDLVYLDTASTSQKPQVVIDSISKFYVESNANIHRGVYQLAERSTLAYEGARDKVANFINADRNEIVFTRNATESINLVRYTFAEDFLKNGDTILVTILEHHSNFVPWLDLAKKKGLNLKIVELNKDGYITAEDVISALDDSVKFVAISHVSNSLGTEIDVKKVILEAHKFGAKVLVDACQSIVHQQIDVKDLDSDFLVFSSHKLYGPTGVGVLHVKEDLLADANPFLFGGDMIKSVFRDRAEFQNMPYKYEAGTPDIAGVVGLGVTLDYITDIGYSKIKNHDLELTNYAFEKLQELDFVKILGPLSLDLRVSALSFNVEGVHAHDVAQILSDENVCVRAGHHCTMPLMETLGIPASVRFSFGIYNEKEDVDRAIMALHKVKKIFG